MKVIEKWPKVNDSLGKYSKVWKMIILIDLKWCNRSLSRHAFNVVNVTLNFLLQRIVKQNVPSFKFTHELKRKDK